MNILNLLIYMDITILVGAFIVIAIQNKELNKKCNEILGK
ncbi:hypothetical protein VT91_31660 [Clostridium sporogenes]|nr:hypothetical protein WG71_32210 [Clostridium sporogenes]KRU25663.1 hypothetical protein VT91_31660 [Clostridium sporogenes]KRU30708.1 hypothetical protein VT28_16180 [Clostridium sporogenes]KRU50192.1 hypothetical protein VT95_01110 [Clostridium sporogenes]OQP97714.1 hypothetical protein VT92_0214550 [Clostridium sporogenes]